jgi:hypothetical protein
MFQQRRFLVPLARDGLRVPVDELFREEPADAEMGASTPGPSGEARS